jgi:hypothetical protein
MNGKRIIILVSALIVSALIVWHDLPIEFPSIIVLAVASFAYVFAGRKKKSS